MPGAEMFQASADVYDRHVGRYGPPLAEALIAFAGVEPGMRALDVGCGPGALATALAAKLGAENVSGADPSEPFAEACQALDSYRRHLGVPDGPFELTARAWAVAGVV